MYIASTLMSVTRRVQLLDLTYKLDMTVLAIYMRNIKFSVSKLHSYRSQHVMAHESKVRVYSLS